MTLLHSPGGREQGEGRYEGVEEVSGLQRLTMVNKKGVTLIELIIVFVIIAIGAVLVAPNIGAWLPNYRLRSATRDIVSTMRTAQMKAVSTNTEYQVLFNADGSYILQHNTGSGFFNEGVAQTLPSGIRISAFFPGNIAHFNPNSTSSTGSMTLTNTKQTKQITLTPSTGRIHIQ
jgi:prepilin-type N-terminal cleavage/methylation domain-containing protein